MDTIESIQAEVNHRRREVRRAARATRVIRTGRGAPVMPGDGHGDGEPLRRTWWRWAGLIR